MQNTNELNFLDSAKEGALKICYPRPSDNDFAFVQLCDEKKFLQRISDEPEKENKQHLEGLAEITGRKYLTRISSVRQFCQDGYITD
jgi:hypothetical protein